MHDTILLAAVFSACAFLAAAAPPGGAAVACCAKFYGDKTGGKTCATSSCPSKNSTAGDGGGCRTGVGTITNNGVTTFQTRTDGAIDCVQFGADKTANAALTCDGSTKIAADAHNGFGCPCTSGWCKNDVKPATTPTPTATPTPSAAPPRLPSILTMALPLTILISFSLPASKTL